MSSLTQRPGIGPIVIQRTISRNEKRRHPRFFLGLPVRIHLSGEPTPTTIELTDVSAGGGYFRSPDIRPDLEQRAAFGFVVGKNSVCAALGHVVRLDAHGFALVLETSNAAFRDFVRDMSGTFPEAA